MALLALPPDALVGVGYHVGRLQTAIALLVPLPRDLGMRRPQVVVAFQHLAVAAVGATAVGAAGPVVGGDLPCVPTPASPPGPPRAVGDDAVGPQVAVQLPIPLSQKLGVLAHEVVEHPRFLGGSSLKSSLSTYLQTVSRHTPVFLAISETLSPLAPQLAYMTLLGHADLSFPDLL